MNRGPHSTKLQNHILKESRVSVQANMQKFFSAPDTELLHYNHETRAKDGHARDMEQRSFVGMDIRTTILEELHYPVLKIPSNLALRDDGSVDLSEVVSGFWLCIPRSIPKTKRWRSIQKQSCLCHLQDILTRLELPLIFAILPNPSLSSDYFPG